MFICLKIKSVLADHKKQMKTKTNQSLSREVLVLHTVHSDLEIQNLRQAYLFNEVLKVAGADETDPHAL